MKICLIIVFNHRYDKNLEKLREIYRDKFDNIKFLVPFYDGKDADVFPVFESSHYFQGYFAQAYSYISDDSFDHYIFIADDILLNPQINQNNILNELGVGQHDGYITSCESLCDFSIYWPNTIDALERLDASTGVNYRELLPHIDVANNAFTSKGIYNVEINNSNLLRNNRIQPFQFSRALSHILDRSWSKSKLLNRITSKAIKLCFKSAAINAKLEIALNIVIKHNILKLGYKLSYPLAAGYSDFIIIPKKSIQNFCYISGIFSSIKLFVEVAIPTAMVLTCDKILAEANSKSALKCKLLWDSNSITDMEREYNCDLNKLLECFPGKTSFVHPVKLSKWSYNQ